MLPPTWLVQVADITGEPGEVGFMGYGETSQKGSGVHTRQYARAFIAVDRASGKRNLIVVLGLSDQLAVFA